MKMISVIVPAYNVEKYISRCLDSIISQTYENLEIIVIDDGSMDNTPKIIDAYSLKDNRMKVIHQVNCGLSGARNAGLKIASGDYIGYVDGDDYIHSEMYSKMVSELENNNADIAICAYKMVGKNGDDIRDKNPDCSGDVFDLSKEEALDTYISDNKSFHIYNSVWSKLFKREIVDGEIFPLGRNSEDIMYTTKALCKADRCVFVDEPLYFYVQDRDESIMNRSDKLAYRRFNDELPFWKEHISYIYDTVSEELSKKAAFYFYRRLLFYYLDFYDRKMPEDGVKLKNYIKKDQLIISDVYSETFISKGDRMRMRLFLFSPFLYRLMVCLYDHIIIPLRTKLC